MGFLSSLWDMNPHRQRTKQDRQEKKVNQVVAALREQSAASPNSGMFMGPRGQTTFLGGGASPRQYMQNPFATSAPKPPPMGMAPQPMAQPTAPPPMMQPQPVVGGGGNSLAAALRARMGRMGSV